MHASTWRLDAPAEGGLGALAGEAWAAGERVCSLPPVLGPEGMTLAPRWDWVHGRILGIDVCPAGDVCAGQEHTGARDTRLRTHIAGLSRGVEFDPPVGFVRGDAPAPPTAIAQSKKDSLNLIMGATEEIDAIVPTYVAPPVNKARQQTRAGWAVMLDAEETPAYYTEHVARNPALRFPFELDAFQKQAIAHIEQGDSVFVAAHTSAGKTAVAEYAIALATRRHMTRAVYTSPIKALSNQKFRDFRRTFGAGPGDVGLLTGDVQINPDAGCLIMTTEILRSMLYRGAEMLADVEVVVFDEVHYVNDASRGVVWEEVLIMLPAACTLVMLSATTPNTAEFADWIGRTRGRPVYVVSTPKRPVPLAHYVYVDGPVPRDVAHDYALGTERFLAGERGPLAASNGEGGAAYEAAPLMLVVDGERRFCEPGYRAYQAVLAERKRASPYAHKGAASAAATFPALAALLRKRSLLPAVVFTFSRRLCETNADALGGTDMLGGAAEKSAVRMFMARCVRRLAPVDRALPQIARLRDMLARGVAVHHSGLLPIMKEAVEVLFARGLVRILFATETFAMGVNMPARTVVFSSLRKHDGESFRTLQPGEYTQMAGRAGRRGLDAVGTVVILAGGATADPDAGEATLRAVVLGQADKLVSRFRLTYGMVVLGLLRMQRLRMEDMLRSSFAENATQRLRPDSERRLEECRLLITTAPDVSCSICRSHLLPDGSAIGLSGESGLIGDSRSHGDTISNGPGGDSRSSGPGGATRPGGDSEAIGPGGDIKATQPGGDSEDTQPGGVIKATQIGQDTQPGGTSNATGQHLTHGLTADGAESYGMLAAMYEAARVCLRDGAVLHEQLASAEHAGRKAAVFVPGRVLVIARRGEHVPALLLRVHGPRDGSVVELSVLVLDVGASAHSSIGASDSTVDRGHNVVPPTLVRVPRGDARLVRCLADVRPRDVVYVTTHTVARMPDMGTTRHYRERDVDAAHDLLAAALCDPCAQETPPWGVLPLPNMRDFALDERRLRRGEALAACAALSRAMAACPDAEEHFRVYAARTALHERAGELAFELSDESLALLPEYRARLAVLRTLGYVAGTLVQVKGRVAVELNTVHELMATEMLFANAFAACDAAEAVALLSAMVFQDGTPAPSAPGGDDRPSAELEDVLARISGHPALVAGVHAMRASARRLEALQRDVSADSGAACDAAGDGPGAAPAVDRIPLNFGLVHVVHAWARGVSFVELTSQTEVLEGTVVRCIVRLDETCREVRTAAQIMGNPGLARKMEDASRLIKRDICFASSLYI